MATIVILEHLLQRGLGRPYMVYTFAERWRAEGHRVLVHHGPEDPPAGDLAVLNIDLTVVPPAYRAALARYPRVINGAVLDISKRKFSQQLLGRDSDWHGPVIVKTDANFGGRAELQLHARARRLRVKPDIPGGIALKDYPIYDRLGDVPLEVWNSPELVVEKFIPEHDDRGYYMRVWTFFGDRERSSRYRAAVRVIKSHHLLEREAVSVPAELRAQRQQLGFDFGKFDYVSHEGGFALLDVNRTPAAPARLLADPAIRAGMEQLAAGLQAFLP